MDDETYVPIDPKNLNFKKYYNFNDLNEVPDDVRFVGVEKFAKQYLMGITRKKLRLVGQGGVYEPFKVKN